MDIKSIFEQEKEDYYGVGNFWRRNYIEYRTNGD